MPFSVFLDINTWGIAGAARGMNNYSTHETNFKLLQHIVWPLDKNSYTFIIKKSS